MDTLMGTFLEKTVAFHTLGCRLNMAETGAITHKFIEGGYKVLPFGEKADVVVVNTCTVTDRADSTCRRVIRLAHRSSPQGKIVVIGCYAQMGAEQVAQLPGVDLVLGTGEKNKIFDYLKHLDPLPDPRPHPLPSLDSHLPPITARPRPPVLAKRPQVRVSTGTGQRHAFEGASTMPGGDHTRAFLKIQDGCNYICSFCIIPFARGRSRTISVEAAEKEARALVAKGIKEIVMTGVNIGEYEQTSGHSLAELVRAILSIEGLERLRISSVEPNTITNDLLMALKSSPKSMDHFHIPLQSGDDQILTSMRRKYKVAQYREVISQVKGAFPHASIGADVIVGYPRETSEQFRNTYELLEELPITHFHVFPYSKRTGTRAASLPNHLNHRVKKERLALLVELGERKWRQFCEKLVGKTFPVLFESRNKGGGYEGHTSHYIKVEVKAEMEGQRELKNQILPVLLERIPEPGAIQRIRGVLLPTVLLTRANDAMSMEAIPTKP